MRNKVLQATFWYTFSNFLLKGIVFITAPIFARILTKAEFGYFSNYTAWHQLVGIIITLSLLPTLIRGRFDYESDLNSFVASNLVLGSLATVISSLFILLNGDFFSRLFVLDKKYLAIMCLSLVVSPAYDMFMAMQRYAYKYKTVTFLTILISLSSIGISLLLISIMKDHLLARILGSSIPLFFVSLCIYIHYLCFCHGLKVEYWKYSIPIAVPYIFHHLSGSILGQSDRAMITYICGAEDTALYSMAYNVALVVNLVISSMNSAFEPWLGDKLHLRDYASINRHTRGYLGLFAFLIVLLMLIAPEALLFLGGEKYSDAKYVIPPVMVGCYFFFVYSMYVNVEKFEKQTKPMAFATFLAALVNIFTNWMFIPIFGYIAAAYTTLFCYILLLGFHYFLILKMNFGSIYDIKFIFIVSIIVCIVMIIALWLYQATFIRYIVFITCICSLSILILQNKDRLMVYLE